MQSEEKESGGSTRLAYRDCRSFSVGDFCCRCTKSERYGALASPHFLFIHPTNLTEGSAKTKDVLNYKKPTARAPESVEKIGLCKTLLLVQLSEFGGESGGSFSLYQAIWSFGIKVRSRCR